MRFVRTILFLLGFALIATPVAHAQTAAPCTIFAEDAHVQQGDVRRCDPFNILNGDLRIDAGGSVRGDVNVIRGEAIVDGRIRGALNVFGDASVSGRIDGDVYTTGDLRLGSDARVTGSVSSLGAIERAPGADLAGPVRSASEILDAGRSSATDARALWVARASGLIGTALLAALFGVLAIVVVPRGVERARMATGRSTGGAIAATFLGGGVWIILAAALLPVMFIAPGLGALLLMVLGGAGAALGFVALGERLGSRIAGRMGRRVRAALGTAILATLIAAPFYPRSWSWLFVGLAVSFVVLSWSMGATLLSRFGTRTFDDGEQGADEDAVPTPGGSDVQGASDGTRGAHIDSGGDADGTGWGPVAGAGTRSRASDGPAPGDGQSVERPDGTSESRSDRSAPSGAPGGHGSAASEAAGARSGTSALEETPDEPPADGVPESPRTGSPATELGPSESADEAAFRPPADEDTAVEDEQSMPADDLPAGGDDERLPDDVADGGPVGSGPRGPAGVERVASIEDIPGVTPIYAALLAEGGIDSLDQLADCAPGDVVRMVAAPGVLPITRATAQYWVEAARDA